ncbi:MAG: hypothetical protein J5994_10890 [Ruminococcus sp.]|nr:hypothetical protein [Ruminococcus sp.]
MRSSLRTPTEISLANAVGDAVHKNIGLSFRVNCDSLSWVVVVYRDNETGEQFGWYYPKGGEMLARHNGEIWRGTFGPNDWMTAGHDYTAQMTIFQNYPQSVEKPLNTGEGKYDVYMGAGKIQQDSSGTTEAYLDKDITSIRNPERFDGRLIGGCMLKTGTETVLIESYNRYTGKAVLASGLSSAPKAGDEYKLISNYIDCEPFVFYCRSDPECELTVKRTEEGLTVSGIYSQAEEVAMQSYQFTLMGSTVELEKSGKKFTYTFEHTFPFNDCKRAGKRVKCIVTTQDNFSKEFYTGYISEEISEGGITNVTAVQHETAYAVIRFETASSGTFSIFREDENGNDVFIKNITNAHSGVHYAQDYTAGSNQTYIYTVCACIDGAVYCARSEPVRFTDGRSCLVKLTDKTDVLGRRRFGAGKAFVFECDTDNGAISTVLGNTYDLTNSPTPKLISGGNKFDTGTFTAVLETIDSTGLMLTSGYARIRAWTDFISQPGLFLYKNGDGDVKVVAITGNPSRTYGADAASLGITGISYEWTEVTDIGMTIIE